MVAWRWLGLCLWSMGRVRCEFDCRGPTFPMSTPVGTKFWPFAFATVPSQVTSYLLLILTQPQHHED